MVKISHKYAEKSQESVNQQLGIFEIKTDFPILLKLQRTNQQGRKKCHLALAKNTCVPASMKKGLKALIFLQSHPIVLLRHQIFCILASVAYNHLMNHARDISDQKWIMVDPYTQRA